MMIWWIFKEYSMYKGCQKKKKKKHYKLSELDFFTSHIGHLMHIVYTVIDNFYDFFMVFLCPFWFIVIILKTATRIFFYQKKK